MSRYFYLHSKTFKSILHFTFACHSQTFWDYLYFLKNRRITEFLNWKILYSEKNFQRNEKYNMYNHWTGLVWFGFVLISNGKNLAKRLNLVLSQCHVVGSKTRESHSVQLKQVFVLPVNLDLILSMKTLPFFLTRNSERRSNRT